MTSPAAAQADGWSTGQDPGGYGDRPRVFLSRTVDGDFKVKMAFSTYLMFHPGGPLDQWVPVKAVDWGWSATVQAVATAATGFVLLAASPAPSAPAPTPEDESAHPLWELNVANDPFVPDADQNTPVLAGPPV